jgi:hypothetical protein
MKKIFLHELTLEELKTSIGDIIREEFSKNNKPQKPDEVYYSRTQLASILSCSLSSLGKYVKNGSIKAKRLNGKIYFLKSDIEASMVSIKTFKHSRSN